VICRAIVLPSPPALLSIRSQQDPVPSLRAACAAAVAGLPHDEPVVVLAAPVTAANRGRGVTVPLGHRVAAALLGDRSLDPVVAVPGAAARLRETPGRVTLVVMADGSARRGEKAPGHVHSQALPFDECIEEALRSGDAGTLAGLDPALGEELWCEGVAGLRVLGELARGHEIAAEVSYADAPYGVAWWVARWDLH
jgi:hypothetical protein